MTEGLLGFSLGALPHSSPGGLILFACAFVCPPSVFLLFTTFSLGSKLGDFAGAPLVLHRWANQGELQKEDGTMGVQKEDVEKFLNGNPAFAKQYFTKKLDSAALSKMSGLSQKQIDFGHFQDLSQVTMSGL